MIVEGIFTFLSKILFFTSFVGEKGSFPQPLSREEEAECLKKSRTGDTAAKEKLIRHNLRLVAHVVKKYNNAAEVDDMISVGSIGLIKAIGSYEDGKGTQLATYAAKCIENEILMYIRKNKKHRVILSLNDSVGTDKDGAEIALMDLLCSGEESVIDQVEGKVVLDKVIRTLRTALNQREYHIIALRYGLDGNDIYTQREVAKTLNISRSYISRIEKKALQKVKEQLKV